MEGELGKVVSAAVLALTLSLSVTGVLAQPQGGQSPRAYDLVHVDSSTPEATLRSLWALQDARGESICQITIPAAETSREDGQLALATGQFRRLLDGIHGGQSGLCDSYSRRIDRWTERTDTRVVAHVTIRNSSPIPEGANSLPFEYEARQNGQRYRYVLVREGQRWLVQDIMAFESSTNSFVSRTELAEPFYPYMTSPF